ncbi:MAG TPA: HipA domain-containing protein [Noviherbaspirillum sp.]|nr:HipA domain-containing protein [Noviherbaspirillum sp.]
MTTSRPLYVYLQRPDTGDWVTVGRYLFDDASQTGRFRYAPSYVDAGLAWSIDPVGLPFRPGHDWVAQRYRGLHDALRDACPDAWGRALLRRQYGLPEEAPDWRYLEASSNAERWGALAVGRTRHASVAHVASPRLPQLAVLAQELVALAQHAPPVDARLRQRLVATLSMGGARPKATVCDGDLYWLVKPYLPSDIANVPLLEHSAQTWGRAAGLDFATTVYHPLGTGIGAVRVQRFDRAGKQRLMALSGATLLQTEYPGASRPAEWSYSRLAEELRRIGAPPEDRLELFGRMVFNAVCGNDDDHPRNHAVVFRPQENRWRLSPAFDVVPNPDPDVPPMLSMQLAPGRTDIARDAALGDAVRFGFGSRDEAATYLDQLLERIEHGFTAAAAVLTDTLRAVMERRLRENLARLHH